MRALTLFLKFLSVAFIATSVLHLVFGLGADALLGSPVTQAMLTQPSFDSQNRFYGVTFALMGVVLFIAASDLQRYRPMAVAVLGVLFAAGIARAISWVLNGQPAPAIVGILIADLLLPPILYAWLKRHVQR